MRLVATAPIPVVSLGVLSLVTALTSTTPIASVAPTVDIASSAEPIKYREQVADPEAQPPAAPRPALHHSVWEGTYVCLQGLSSVKLTIDVDARGVATARYDFGPVPSNPEIPKTGAFILVGTLIHQRDGGFRGELDAREWISRPDNYFMVPLSIASDDGHHMTGRIHHETCSDFQATRTH